MKNLKDGGLCVAWKICTTELATSIISIINFIGKYLFSGQICMYVDYSLRSVMRGGDLAMFVAILTSPRIIEVSWDLRKLQGLTSGYWGFVFYRLLSLRIPGGLSLSNRSKIHTIQYILVAWDIHVGTSLPASMSFRLRRAVT